MDQEKASTHEVYEVLALWDSEAGVWVAESEDVPGLVAEAESPNVLAETASLNSRASRTQRNPNEGWDVEIPGTVPTRREQCPGLLMASFTPKVNEVLRAHGCHFDRPGAEIMKSGTVRSPDGAFR